MRVLFADDQIPSSNTADNERCKEELRRELSAELVDFDAAFAEDFKWFTELVRYLSIDMGLRLDTVTSFWRAKELAQKRGDYDIAVIDLSWTGDPALKHEEKKNAGLEILRLIAEGNRTSERYKPTIALSQNFVKSPELFAQVLETGALPIAKDYSSTGQRSVAAAIKLMGVQYSMLPFQKELDLSKVSISKLIGMLTAPQLVAVGAALLAMLSSVAVAAFNFGAGKWP